MKPLYICQKFKPKKHSDALYKSIGSRDKSILNTNEILLKPSKKNGIGLLGSDTEGCKKV